MGSTNPVFILPEAIQQRADKIAQGFSGSVTLGVGQFCTNPGMLIYEETDSENLFTKQLEEEFQKTSGGAMLAENIFDSYGKGISQHSAIKGIEVLANGNKSDGANAAQPVLFKTT